MKKLFKVLFVSILFTLIGSLNVFASDITEEINNSESTTELISVLITEYGNDDDIQMNLERDVESINTSKSNDGIDIKYTDGYTLPIKMDMKERVQVKFQFLNLNAKQIDPNDPVLNVFGYVLIALVILSLMWLFFSL